MRNKLSAILLIGLAAILIFTACGTGNSPAAVSTAEPLPSAEPTAEAPCDAADIFEPLSIEAQSRLMSSALYTEQGGRLYSNFFRAGAPSFGYFDKQQNMYIPLTERSVGCLEFSEGCIYCTLCNHQDSGLYRFSEDFSETELLYAIPGLDVHDAMQFYEGSFYFSDPSNAYRFSEISKEAELHVVLDKELRYPVIHDGWLLYQDVQDKESLHWYNMNTAEDYKISENPSHFPLFDGRNIYYVEKCSDAADKLIRIKPDGSEPELLFEGRIYSSFTMLDGYIYFVNADDEYRLWRVGTGGEHLSSINSPAYCQNPAALGNYLITEHLVPSLEYFYEYLRISPGSGQVLDIF